MNIIIIFIWKLENIKNNNSIKHHHDKHFFNMCIRHLLYVKSKKYKILLLYKNMLKIALFNNNYYVQYVCVNIFLKIIPIAFKIFAQ